MNFLNDQEENIGSNAKFLECTIDRCNFHLSHILELSFADAISENEQVFREVLVHRFVRLEKICDMIFNSGDNFISHSGLLRKGGNKVAEKRIGGTNDGGNRLFG